jgi:hypoxanthine-DNA glycosylase
LLGFDHEVDYVTRIQQIESRPIILWDSLKACYRPGSLDSKIDDATAEANDFPWLLRQHPEIRAILFNGATSEKYFRKLALPLLTQADQIELLRMPVDQPGQCRHELRTKTCRLAPPARLPRIESLRAERSNLLKIASSLHSSQ